MTNAQDLQKLIVENVLNQRPSRPPPLLTIDEVGLTRSKPMYLKKRADLDKRNATRYEHRWRRQLSAATRWIRQLFAGLP